MISINSSNNRGKTMSNFETGITYSPTGNNDISDRAREVSNWNTETAVSEAKRHGLDISDEHFDVIHFLRDYYVEHGWPKSVHKLSRLGYLIISSGISAANDISINYFHRAR